jgi:hypothetical protein
VPARAAAICGELARLTFGVADGAAIYAPEHHLGSSGCADRVAVSSARKLDLSSGSSYSADYRRI